jgi:hypothetical protein
MTFRDFLRTMALATVIAGASSCGSHSSTSVSAKSGFTLPVSNASGAPQSYADVVDRVTPAEIKAALQKSGSRPVVLLVARDGKTLFLAVQPRS